MGNKPFIVRGRDNAMIVRIEATEPAILNTVSTRPMWTVRGWKKMCSGI